MSRHLNVAFVAALCGVATADLPVHCLKHQVEGDWNFFVGSPSSIRSSCGHQHPDTEDGQPARALMVGAKTSTKSISLQSPNLVKAGNEHGKWTMLYDEGFEVTIGDRVFFAFSNFTFQKDPITQAKQNMSHCGDTMVGWYRSLDRKEWGCYYGVKAEKVEAAATHPAPAAARPAHDDHVKLNNATMTAKVEKLNKKLSMLQLGWNARVMPKFIGRTMKEVNAYAGLHRTTPVRDMQRGMSQPAARRAKSFLQARSVKLPEGFDWSNASGGMDWLEPVMDQADCGSCYVASTMRMLSVRHKITQNDPNALPWSINMPLHCSEYNQGCKGGYGSLVSKWGEDVGLVPATCMRYNTAGSCKLECELDKLEGKRYRAANHRFIGSFYGNSTVREMMEEIYHNGPIVVSFEPAEDFMFYSDGIYKSAVDKTHPQSVAPNMKERVANPWKKTDHAVVAVGWGVEDGQKYWRIQNSWGEDWGEDGFFRMAMGVDESAVESIPEAADVIEDEQNGRQVAEFFKQLK